MKNDDNFSEGEEEEEILVYVNFDDPVDDFPMKDLAATKILGLDSDEPILQIGNKVCSFISFPSMHFVLLLLLSTNLLLTGIRRFVE